MTTVDAAAKIVEELLASREPSIRYKIRVGVLGEKPSSRAIQTLRTQIRDSERVQVLLSGRDAAGRIPGVPVYQKWRGAHWVLVALADIGYPSGDPALQPLRDQVLDHWLAPRWFEEFRCATQARSYSRRGVPLMDGRYRRCASQQGNALYAIATLGLLNDRPAHLVERLLHWQWPDGGWNCDRRPAADTSSFMETLTPLRGLVAFHKLNPAPAVERAIIRAAGVFLDRRLYRRRSDGAIIHPDFLKLHYPPYWHYDILCGLKVLVEAGMIRDPRCRAALDALATKQLPDGGFPAERRLYRVSKDAVNRSEPLDWGPAGTQKSNEWVTADALSVLAAAGRLS